MNLSSLRNGRLSRLGYKTRDSHMEALGDGGVSQIDGALLHFASVVLAPVLCLIIVRGLIGNSLPIGTDILTYRIDWPHNYLYVWNSDGMGAPKSFDVRLLLSFVAMLTGDPIAAVKFYLAALIMVSYLGIYLFGFLTFRDRIGAVVGGVTYVFSQTFMFMLSDGSMVLATIYAVAPFGFLALEKVIRSTQRRSAARYSLVLAFFLATMVLSRPDLSLYWLALMGIYAVASLLGPWIEHSRRSVAANLAIAVAVQLVFVPTMLAFLFLPLAANFGPAYVSPWVYRLPFSVESSFSLDIYRSLLLFSWPSGYIAQWISPEMNFLLPMTLYYGLRLVVPLVSFGVLLVRKNRYIVSFTLCTVVGIFLSQGPREPYGFLNSWLNSNIPLMNILHNANLWLAPATMFCSLLCAGFIAYLRCWSRSTRSQRVAFHGMTFRMSSRVLVVFFVTTLILSSGASATYLVTDGLQSWMPPSEYVDGYKWLRNIGDDSLVLPVPYGQAYMHPQALGWSELAATTSDLGLISPYFSQKPILNPGSLSGVEFGKAGTLTGLLGDYLGGLIMTNGTRYATKMLGSFNVRYVVVEDYPPTANAELGRAPPGYAQTYQQDFFRAQTDLHPVFNNSVACVFENGYWQRLLHAYSGYFTVVGGFEAFTYLGFVPQFDASNTFIVFLSEMASEGEGRLAELIGQSRGLIFVNSDLSDLIALVLHGEYSVSLEALTQGLDELTTWVPLVPLAVPPYDWAGQSMLSSKILYTSGNATGEAEFTVDSQAEYALWVRVYVGQNGGRLILRMDDRKLLDLSTKSLTHGFTWLRVRGIGLKAGTHTLTVEGVNSGKSILAIDTALIMPASTLDATEARIVDSIAGTKVTYLLGSSYIFSEAASNSEGWILKSDPFEASGGAAVNTTSGGKVSVLLDAVPSSGRYDVYLRARAAAAVISVQAGKYYQSYNLSLPSDAGFSWARIARNIIPNGKSNLILGAEGALEIDQLLLIPEGVSEEADALNSFFSSEQPNVKITWSRIDPTRYSVSLDGTAGKTFLGLAQSYHPGWVALLNRKQISPYIANGLAMAFPVETYGSATVVLSYSGQHYADVGLIVSVGTIVVSSIAVATLSSSSPLARKLRHKLIEYKSHH